MEKLCVYLIGPFVMSRKIQKEKLNFKYVMVIDPVTGSYELMEYNKKRAISIANLVETTWLSRYPRTM